MNFEMFIEPIGTLASFIILVSLIMRSVKRLRIINLIGAVIFVIYGYFIVSYPIIIMNTGIIFINIYYLAQMFKSEDYFKVIAIDKDDEYLKAFLSFYRDDINNTMTFTQKQLHNSDYRFLILRNMTPAGIFITNEYNEDTLEITLDYAIPAYQDFKTTDYVFKNTSDALKDQGYTKFITFTDKEKHINYLKRMGFEQTTLNNQIAYIKKI